MPVSVEIRRATGNSETGAESVSANREDNIPWKNERSQIIYVDFVNQVVPMNTKRWFQGCENLIEIKHFQNLNTSSVINMSSMFWKCSKITSIDLSNFDTRKVVNMSGMFYKCIKLEYLNLSTFDTRNVTSMGSMFDGGYSYMALKEIDLSGSFNTDKLENTNCMFSWCKDLKTIYVNENFNNTNITRSTEMFYRCNALIGGNGTKFNSSIQDKTYARIDGGPTSSTPGYFTLKSIQ